MKNPPYCLRGERSGESIMKAGQIIYIIIILVSQLSKSVFIQTFAAVRLFIQRFPNSSIRESISSLTRFFFSSSGENDARI